MVLWQGKLLNSINMEIDFFYQSKSKQFVEVIEGVNICSNDDEHEKFLLIKIMENAWKFALLSLCDVMNELLTNLIL